MITEEIYITRFSAWAPGVESASEWNEWALDKRSMFASQQKEIIAPKLSYTDSTFRRRLSLISKMTIQVIHDLLPIKEETKILFFSFRGELAREYQIFKMLTEEGEISPAVFSLSGFNTPVALATIAFGLKGGYSAMYPAEDSFYSCIKAAQSSLLCGKADELVLVYADENIPEECGCVFKENPVPAAFALLLSRKGAQGNFSPVCGLSSLCDQEKDNPLAFFKKVLLAANSAP